MGKRATLGLGALLGLAWLGAAHAADIEMFVGEVRVLNTGPIERVAVGNGNLMSTSIVADGQLLLLGEQAGKTDLHIWYRNGREEQYTLEIAATDTSAELAAVRSLLRSEAGLSARRVGTRIVIEGELQPESESVVDAIAGAFDDIINLTRPAKVGDQKMVYMGVKVTEFSTSRLKEIGIAWDQRFNGPSAGLAVENTSADEISVLDNSPLSPQNATNAENPALGFFGIATQVNSLINLAVSNGDALILAEPTLSARSGGEAEFLSGGEIPLETTSVDGQTNVEFREFGTRLTIRPVADDSGRVVADVEVEISSLDRDLAVGNIPGFRSRKTSTSVVLSDGETLVISGLTDTQVSENVDKVAGLGDLPIIGALFRSTTFENRKSELVIFVTPRIIDASSEFNRAQLERSEALKQKFLEATDREDLILD